jgi:hypothetical protein
MTLVVKLLENLTKEDAEKNIIIISDLSNKDLSERIQFMFQNLPTTPDVRIFRINFLKQPIDNISPPILARAYIFRKKQL